MGKVHNHYHHYIASIHHFSSQCRSFSRILCLNYDKTMSKKPNIKCQSLEIETSHRLVIVKYFTKSNEQKNPDWTRIRPLVLLTAFVLDPAHLGVVRVLPEVHRTGHVVVYPAHIFNFVRTACFTSFCKA